MSAGFFFSNRKMSSIQPQLDYLMAYWNIPCVFTYPIPPYLTLRINIGFHQGPPFPRPRLLLDMIRKFSSAKDGRYYRSDEEEGTFAKPTGEVYKIRTSQISQIHDVRNKWIFYNPPPILMASPKQKSEGVNSYGLPSGYLGSHGSFSSSFGGGHNRRYYGPDEEEVLRLPGREVYKKRTSQTSQIHDEGNKLIPDNPSSRLMATHTQNTKEGAKFVITTYSQQSLNAAKVPVTLKIQGTNLYLSCINGDLTLEDPNNNGETLNTIEGSTRRFLFLRPRTIKSATFESVTSQGMLISTDTSETSPVKMSKSSDQEKIIGFLIDEEGVRFNMVGNNRFSLQAPMEIPERLQEYKQLMGNTYERFTYRPYGILCFGRLDI